MATQTIVTCDLHADGSTPGETIEFALDGENYEIDLCEQHDAELRGSLAVYLEMARHAGSLRAARRRPSGSSTRTPRRSDLAEIRAWAAEQGYEIAERGRIPSAIVEEYDATQKKRRRR